MIFGSKDFMKASHKIKDNEESREKLYSIKRYNYICIVTGPINKGAKLPLFFTITNDLQGNIDFVFLHEICHACEAVDIYKDGRFYRRTGFELSEDENPYNDEKRKYEILSESITDIFAMEATEYLHEQGIYIFEPENIVYEDATNVNMPSIIKKLLYKFVGKYRKHIIRARMTGNMSKSYDVIGDDNFEELNDCINKMENFIRLKKDKGKHRFEFYGQENRLDEIYANMEEFHSKNRNNDKLLESAISLTEEKTRSSQINSWIEKIKAIFSRNKTKDKNER